MKNKFEIHIGEIEGVEYGHYDYKITLDSTEQYLYETNTFEIQGEGIFSFGVIYNNELIGGFTIPVSKLRNISNTFFPLENPYSDLLEIPLCCDYPRVSLSIKCESLYIVHECSEYSNESLFFSQILPKNDIFQALKQELQRKNEIIIALEKTIENHNQENSRLQGIVDDLAENFYKFQDENKEKLAKQNSENIENKEKVSKAEIEKLKLSEENLMLKRQIEILQQKMSLKDLSSDKFEVFDVEATTLKLKESESKRKELQQALNSANNKWLNIKTSNNTLSYLEKENKNLINKVKTLTEQNLENSNFCVSTEESNFMKKIHSLSISAASVKQKNKELKQQIQAVETENNQYKEIIEQFRAEISKKAEQNSELSDQLKIALGKLPHREEKTDQIDKALKEFLKEQGIKNPFVKISEGIYNFGNKRLCFSLKNGFPVIRVGGGYMFVDEFLKMYTNFNKKKEETPRSQSLEGKLGSTGKIKQKVEVENNDSQMTENESNPKIRQEIKILKKNPRRVFIP